MVDVTNDIIELNLDTIPTIDMNDSSSSSSKPSVNFGGGLELLMNNKHMNSGKKSSNDDIGLGDLNNLEQE